MTEPNYSDFKVAHPIEAVRISGASILSVVAMLTCVIGMSFYAGYTRYSDTYSDMQMQELRTLIYAAR